MENYFSVLFRVVNNRDYIIQTMYVFYYGMDWLVAMAGGFGVGEWLGEGGGG